MSKILSFVIEHQQQTEWCWAAVSKSVSAFFNTLSAWTQCSIVNAEMGRNDCCANGQSAFCNCSWYLDRALQRVNNFRNGTNASSSQPLVEQEIDGDNPVGARIGWSGGGGHFVAIYGYDDTNPAKVSIVIGDPWYGVSVVDFNEFTTNYLGMGSWTHTYFTER